MAERVMGKTWQDMDAAQQKVFVDAFAALTNQAFVSAAARPVGGRVRYLSETISGAEARVSATADHPSTEKGFGQIEYRLSRSDDRWLIYDVIVDGVSLTESYQDQLQNVLQRDGFDELIGRMRRRVDARSRD
jgi:phospholipid transport system substrate-binding protein